MNGQICSLLFPQKQLFLSNVFCYPPFNSSFTLFLWPLYFSFYCIIAILYLPLISDLFYKTLQYMLFCSGSVLLISSFHYSLHIFLLPFCPLHTHLSNSTILPPCNAFILHLYHYLVTFRHFYTFPLLHHDIPYDMSLFLFLPV